MQTGSYLWLVMVAVVAADNGCNFGRCNNNNHNNNPYADLEAKVNSILYKQNIGEERFSAMANAFKSEMTSLSEEADANKETIGQLVGDSASLRNQLHLLQDLGKDFAGLSNRVQSMGQELTGLISGVQNQVSDVSDKLKRETETQKQVTVLLNQQLQKNRDNTNKVQSAVEEQRAKTRDLESKMVNLENKMATMGGAGGMCVSNSQMRNLDNKLTDLQQVIDGMKDEYEGILGGLKEAVENLQRRQGK